MPGEPARAVLFDFDGTLWRLRYDLRDWRTRWGRGGRVEEVLQRLTPAERQQAAQELLDAELAGLDAGEPVPGAAELLHRLQAAGVQLAVVSRNSAIVVQRSLQRLGLPAPPLVVGREQAQTPKPDPAPLRQALAAVSEQPSAAWMVGDSDDDRLAAARAEVRFFLVEPAAAPGCFQELASRLLG